MTNVEQLNRDINRACTKCADEFAAAGLPVTIHGLGDLPSCRSVVLAELLEMAAANVRVERDHSLADDHIFAVNRSMSRQAAVAQKYGFLRVINQIVEARVLGNGLH